MLARDLRLGDLVRVRGKLGRVIHGTHGCQNPELCNPPTVRLEGEERASVVAAAEVTLLCPRCLCLYHSPGPCPPGASHAP